MIFMLTILSQRSFLLFVILIVHFALLKNITAGGMTIGDQGSHSEGRGGAFTVKADDLSAIEYNPAGLTNIGGTQFLLSNRFGYAVEEFKRTSIVHRDQDISFERVSNNHPWQLLNPLIAAGANFGLKNWAFAIGAYSPPGVATQDFPEDGGQRFMLIERDVKILYYNLSAAWKLRDFLGLGISLQWVDAAQIKLSLVVDGNTADVINPAGSPLDFKTVIEGSDHVGVSAIIGFWIKPVPFFQLALSGRIVPTPIDAKCKLGIVNVDDRIAIPNMSDDKVTLSMKLPPMARAGVRYIHKKLEKEVFDLELNIKYEAWSMMDQYTLNGHGLVATLAGHEIEIDKIYIDKNWKDTVSIHLGGDYNILDKRLILRAGTFFETGAKEENHAYVDFFASHRLGGALGTSILFFGLDLSLSYTYIYEFPFVVGLDEGKIKQQVPGRPGSESATVNAGEYNSHYHFGTVSLSYTF